MLYILGVTKDSASIKSENKNTQLETVVDTYVGAIEGKSVDSNITVKDPTETWFTVLGEIYNKGIQKNNNLINFYNEEQLKENTFLLRMEYTDQNLANNIEIIFFDTKGVKIDELVKIDIENNTIVVPKKMNMTPTKIRDLIELLTTIKIEDSEKDDTTKVTNMKDKKGNIIPLSDAATAGIRNTKPRVNVNSAQNQINPYPILGKGGSSHKTRKGKRNNTKNNKKGGSKTKRKASLKRGNKKK